jgi:hypothetical protein
MIAVHLLDINFTFTSKLVFPILDTFPISSTIVPAGIGF